MGKSLFFHSAFENSDSTEKDKHVYSAITPGLKEAAREYLEAYEAYQINGQDLDARINEIQISFRTHKLARSKAKIYADLFHQRRGGKPLSRDSKNFETFLKGSKRNQILYLEEIFTAQEDDFRTIAEDVAGKDVGQAAIFNRRIRRLIKRYNNLLAKGDIQRAEPVVNSQGEHTLKPFVIDAHEWAARFLLLLNQGATEQKPRGEPAERHIHGVVIFGIDQIFIDRQLTKLRASTRAALFTLYLLRNKTFDVKEFARTYDPRVGDRCNFAGKFYQVCRSLSDYLPHLTATEPSPGKRSITGVRIWSKVNELELREFIKIIRPDSK